MANEYKAIPTALVTEYAPVTARLMLRTLRNSEAINYAPMHGTNTGNLAVTGGGYTTVFTMPLAVPDCFVGASGTLFSFSASAALDAAGGGAGAAGQYRVLVDGNATNVENLNVAPFGPGAADNFTMTVSFTPTGNTVIDCEFQINLIEGESADFSRDSGFLASLPRAA